MPSSGVLASSRSPATNVSFAVSSVDEEDDVVRMSSSHGFDESTDSLVAPNSSQFSTSHITDNHQILDSKRSDNNLLSTGQLAKGDIRRLDLRSTFENSDDQQTPDEVETTNLDVHRLVSSDQSSKLRLLDPSSDPIRIPSTSTLTSPNTVNTTLSLRLSESDLHASDSFSTKKSPRPQIPSPPQPKPRFSDIDTQQVPSAQVKNISESSKGIVSRNLLSEVFPDEKEEEKDYAPVDSALTTGISSATLSSRVEPVSEQAKCSEAEITKNSTETSITVENRSRGFLASEFLSSSSSSSPSPPVQGSSDCRSRLQATDKQTLDVYPQKFANHDKLPAQNETSTSPKKDPSITAIPEISQMQQLSGSRSQRRISFHSDRIGRDTNDSATSDSSISSETAARILQAERESRRSDRKKDKMSRRQAVGIQASVLKNRDLNRLSTSKEKSLLPERRDAGPGLTDLKSMQSSSSSVSALNELQLALGIQNQSLPFVPSGLEIGRTLQSFQQELELFRTQQGRMWTESMGILRGL